MGLAEYLEENSITNDGFTQLAGLGKNTLYQILRRGTCRRSISNKILTATAGKVVLPSVKSGPKPDVKRRRRLLDAIAAGADAHELAGRFGYKDRHSLHTAVFNARRAK